MVPKHHLVETDDQTSSSRLSLRDEAAKRASLANQREGSEYSYDQTSQPSPFRSTGQERTRSYERTAQYSPIRSPGRRRTSSFPRTSPVPKQQKNLLPQRTRHPLQTPSPVSKVGREETPDEIAQSARKQWRRHGSGVSQVLEETRRLDEGRAGTFSVRVTSAETRQDVSGARYTAYILRVQLPSGNVLQMEHRYSDFYKLNEVLKSHQIGTSPSSNFPPFPSKHWAGRMGSWTPSFTLAKEQYKDLIVYRKTALDVWLVAVVRLYNLGDLPHSVAGSVFDFLTVPHRPPCEEDNSLDDNWKWNNPLSFTLGSSIRQAAVTLQHMCHNDPLSRSDQSIPLDLLHAAKGLCFLTVVKAGLVVSGRIGTGLLIARLSDHRWSAPCALGTVGMGWGMLAGGDITHYLVVLTTHEAVEAFLHGTVQLGAELGVAIGPVGRGATSQVSAANDNLNLHPAYSYAHSKGLFAGISLEGSVLTARNDVNAKFYSRNISPDQILDLPNPKAADPLYKALARAMATEIPEGSFRPSQIFNRGCKPVASSRTSSSFSAVTQSPIHGLPTIDTVGPVSHADVITPSLLS